MSNINTSEDNVNTEEYESDNIITKRHKSDHKDPFTQVPNQVIDNKNLTCRARNLLIYLIRQYPGWKFHSSVMKEYLDCGQNSLEEAFANLRKEGYVKNNSIKDKKTGVWKGSERLFSRYPVFKPESPKSDGSAHPSKTGDSGNRGFNITNTRSINNTNNDLNTNTVPPFKTNYTKKPNINNNARARKDLLPSPPLPATPKRPRSKPPEAASSLGDDFNDFWGLYPNKKVKHKAHQAYDKAMRLPEVDSCLIFTALKAQIAERYHQATHNLFVEAWPHPATWLNQRRWEDETRTEEQIRLQANLKPKTYHESKTEQTNMMNERMRLKDERIKAIGEQMQRERAEKERK